MKSRRYISIAILMILFIVLISSISNATDLDSIYVWSNNTQNTITTSAEPENQRTGNFKPNMWKCYFNGTKYRNNFI